MEPKSINSQVLKNNLVHSPKRDTIASLCLGVVAIAALIFYIQFKPSENSQGKRPFSSNKSLENRSSDLAKKNNAY